jgi:hypothetical protein
LLRGKRVRGGDQHDDVRARKGALEGGAILEGADGSGGARRKRVPFSGIAYQPGDGQSFGEQAFHNATADGAGRPGHDDGLGHATHDGDAGRDALV